MQKLSVSKVSDRVIAKIREDYIAKPKFTLKEIQRALSIGPALWSWVIAVVKYHSACHKIWPKQLESMVT